jgi:hypothetical protein
VTARHFVTAAAVIGGVVATYAAAGWQSKPYNTWTDAELKEVLTDSPWSSKGQITYYQAPGAQSKGATPGAIEDMAMVSWVSSLPLRQAGVRQQITAGAAITKEAEAALAAKPEAYVVAVKIYGGQRSATWANGTSLMQAETFLLRDGKPPIAAIQSEGKALDKDDKVIETPAGGPPRGGGGGGAPRGGAPANSPFLDIQRGGGGGGGFGGGGGGFGAPQGGGGNRPRGVASMLVYVFPKTDMITAADKEVEFTSKLCSAFGGFGGGGGGGGFGGGAGGGGGAPQGGLPANSPLFEMQRGGGGGGGGFGGGGAAAGRPGGGAPTPSCQYNVKKKFKLKDMVFNGDLSL